MTMSIVDGMLNNILSVKNKKVIHRNEEDYSKQEYEDDIELEIDEDNDSIDNISIKKKLPDVLYNESYKYITEEFLGQI